MIEVYALIRHDSIFLLMIAFFAVTVVQGIAASFYDLTHGWWGFLFEVGVLFNLFAHTVVLGTLNNTVNNSTFYILYYDNVRWVLLCAVIALALIAFYKTRRIHIIPAIIMIMTSSILFENISAKLYVTLLILSIVVLLIRSIFLLRTGLHIQRSSISGSSIKEAMDKQHNGLMFFQANGRILLMNRSMARLMSKAGEGSYMNANIYWDILARQSAHKQQHSKQDILIFVDEQNDTFWQFTKSRLNWKHKLIYRISAIDVTEQQKINQKLEQYGEELEKKREKLVAALENINELYAQEAYASAWNEIHDVFGQRVSMLQSYLNSNTQVDLNKLEQLAETLISAQVFSSRFSAEDVYNQMNESFFSIGVNLHREGSFPYNIEIADLFVSIIREAVTNAVRHGNAKNIKIRMHEEETHSLIVMNDGAAEYNELVWGGGLKGIKDKVMRYNGSLKVQSSPEFRLDINIPIVSSIDIPITDSIDIPVINLNELLQEKRDIYD